MDLKFGPWLETKFRSLACHFEFSSGLNSLKVCSTNFRFLFFSIFDAELQSHSNERVHLMLSKKKISLGRKDLD